MKVRMVNAEDAPESLGGYPQALECRETTRRLYISGQVPVAKDGRVPDTFEE